MPKRGRSVHGGSKSGAKREQYLYLVVDDWEKGYSVRKLDVSGFVSDADADADDEAELLAEPPVARLEAVHGNSHCFVAHGTKIVAMRPVETSPAIPAFDTATLATAILPWPEFRMDFGLPVVVSLAGKIFLFMHRTYYLGDPPAPRSPDVFPPPELKPWAWTTIDSPLPFRGGYVVGYAVHPDGHTLFVSTERCASGGPKEATFSFDSESLVWTHRGDWLLPFYGQGYYDAKMEAWVGLCRHKDHAGHLCSCEVLPVTAGAAAGAPPPSWKLGQDKLFHKESGFHLGARLVHMGSSKFCLVESMRRQALAENRILLRITTFGLKYDNKGRLRLRSQRRRECKMFNRAHDLMDFLPNPVAFWI